MEAVCFEVFERTSSSYTIACCDLQMRTFCLGIQEARFTDTMVSHAFFYITLGIVAAIFNHPSVFFQWLFDSDVFCSYYVFIFYKSWILCYFLKIFWFMIPFFFCSLISRSLPAEMQAFTDSCMIPSLNCPFFWSPFLSSTLSCYFRQFYVNRR